MNRAATATLGILAMAVVVLLVLFDIACEQAAIEMAAPDHYHHHMEVR